jgi:hypothetical protein
MARSLVVVRSAPNALAPSVGKAGFFRPINEVDPEVVPNPPGTHKPVVAVLVYYTDAAAGGIAQGHRGGAASVHIDAVPRTEMA